MKQFISDEIDQIKAQFDNEFNDIENKCSYSEFKQSFVNYKENIQSLMTLNSSTAYFYAKKF